MKLIHTKINMFPKLLNIYIYKKPYFYFDEFILILKI